MVLADYLQVPHEVVFKNANVKEALSDPRLANVYKAIHNKGRAERIVRALQAVEEGVQELKDHNNECTHRVNTMVKELETKVRELALSIEI
jgi:hypothetical protein